MKKLISAIVLTLIGTTSVSAELLTEAEWNDREAEVLGREATAVGETAETWTALEVAGSDVEAYEGDYTALSNEDTSNWPALAAQQYQANLTNIFQALWGTISANSKLVAAESRWDQMDQHYADALDHWYNPPLTFDDDNLNGLDDNGEADEVAFDSAVDDYDRGDYDAGEVYYYLYDETESVDTFLADAQVYIDSCEDLIEEHGE